ncbi:Uncharacterized protein FWK35_00026980 [Aphis craccivora]|uniref:Uncharacterized protein n=1 Tax=Aphis craccivora TaxID=307492 RepID=A0A6G0W9Z0_APHCR|nr:Uncharacterized protein FWK35_00026980 [Aphis craccivora]
MYHNGIINFLLFSHSLSIKTYLHHINGRITLSSFNFNRLKLLQPCINANIIELANKLVLYQTVFNNACMIIKCNILYLKPECISDFISSYINILMDMNDEEKSFLLELQKMHHMKFADIVLKLNITK